MEQRQEELRHRQMELEDEEEAREQRLELLRQQVRPDVQFDPMRLHGDTQVRLLAVYVIIKRYSPRLSY